MKQATMERLWNARWVTLALAGLMLGGCGALQQRETAEPGRMALEQQVATARTAAQHEAVAVLYEREARSLETSAEQHRRLGELYGGAAVEGPLYGGRDGLMRGRLARHCGSLERTYRQAAQDAQALALLHRQLAAEAQR